MPSTRVRLTETTSNKHVEVPLNQVLLMNPRDLGVPESINDPNETTDSVYRLRFVTLPNSEHPGEISLEFSGISEVFLNDVAITNHAPITDGELLRIGTETFRISLQTRNTDSNSATLRAGWVTITGSVRPHNEDAIGIYQRAPVYAYIVADGVGGAYAGELISEFAVKYMLRAIHVAAQDGLTDWETQLNTAIKAINTEVRAFSQKMSQRQGRRVQAGSTLTILLIDRGEGYIAHVGDSRVYRLRNGIMYQLTEDHSSVADPTTTTPFGAQRPGGLPPKRNILLKGIGKADTIAPEIFPLKVQLDDRFVLCSDGASDRIGEGELEQWAKAYTIPKTLATYIAEEADRRESRDNISVIVLDVIEDPVTEEMPLPMERAYIGFPDDWLPVIKTPPDAEVAMDTTVDDTETFPLRSTMTMLAPVLPERRADDDTSAPMAARWGWLAALLLGVLFVLLLLVLAR